MAPHPPLESETAWPPGRGLRVTSCMSRGAQQCYALTTLLPSVWGSHLGVFGTDAGLMGPNTVRRWGPGTATCKASALPCPPALALTLHFQGNPYSASLCLEQLRVQAGTPEASWSDRPVPKRTHPQTGSVHPSGTQEERARAGPVVSSFPRAVPRERLTQSPREPPAPSRTVS